MQRLGNLNGYCSELDLQITVYAWAESDASVLRTPGSTVPERRRDERWIDFVIHNWPLEIDLR